MPIFHDYDGFLPQDSQAEPEDQQSAGGRQRRVSQRFRSCPGQQLSRSPASGEGLEQATSALSLRHGRPQRTLTRGELIQRIKRDRSPSWSPELEPKSLSDRTATQTQTTARKPTPSLLPAAEFKEQAVEILSQSADFTPAAEIERPKSALHSGDFRPKTEEHKEQEEQSGGSALLSTSPVAPWHHDFPTAAIERACSYVDRFSFNDGSTETPFSRSRALSQSFNQSGFVLMPPTSPLAQQSNNPDIDCLNDEKRSESPGKSNRRHTFSPQYLQSFSGLLERSTSSTLVNRKLPSIRREGTIPYQAHQPRRSLSSALNIHPTSSPQIPIMRPRRPSVSGAAESSPLHHAPLVGSYEESILRGRMSTTPSRPLDFVAQIGVLGRGNCRSSLKCPSHVTVPFPAVFYSYASGNGRISDNQPSPYVGLIDLEHSLPHNQTSRRSRTRYATPASDDDKMDIIVTSATPAIPDGNHNQATDKRKREKRKRRPNSPKSPPGGSYRIPQQGQLQIVLKNPNKTAVKLFLVPYDLEGMEAGQKTFLRQRSYSDNPSAPSEFTSSTQAELEKTSNNPELASLEGFTHLQEEVKRPTLRYLVHLHICCTAKGRYYLYKSIRVVFANRVPDGKEHLRNEIQMPEPRYSTYKPIREPAATTHSSITARVLRSLSAASDHPQAQLVPADFNKTISRPHPSLTSSFDSSNMSSHFRHNDTVAPWQGNAPPTLVKPIPFSLSKPTSSPQPTPNQMVASLPLCADSIYTVTSSSSSRGHPAATNNPTSDPFAPASASTPIPPTRTEMVPTFIEPGPTVHSSSAYSNDMLDVAPGTTPSPNRSSQPAAAAERFGEKERMGGRLAKGKSLPSSPTESLLARKLKELQAELEKASGGK